MSTELLLAVSVLQARCLTVPAVKSIRGLYINSLGFERMTLREVESTRRAGRCPCRMKQTDSDIVMTAPMSLAAEIG